MQETHQRSNKFGDDIGSSLLKQLNRMDKRYKSKNKNYTTVKVKNSFFQLEHDYEKFKEK